MITVVARENRAGLRATTGIGEALVVWSMFAVVAIEMFATYARTPAVELFQPQYAGLAGATHRLLLVAGFPVALAAIPIVALVAARVRRPVVTIVATVAAITSATVLGSGIVAESDADVKTVNVVAVSGVVAALALTVMGVREAGVGHLRQRQQGDVLRVFVALALLALAPPWIAADLGVSLDRVPLLRRLYITDVPVYVPGRGTIAAVHDGHHHGMDGVLLALTALLLSRGIPWVAQKSLRMALVLYLSVLFAYGTENALQDFWGEQIVKRGWTTATLPETLLPRASLAWGLLIVAGLGVAALSSRTFLGPRV